MSKISYVSMYIDLDTALHRTVGPHLCYDKWKGQRLRDIHCKKLCKLGS